MRTMTIGRQVAAGFAACLVALLLTAVVGTLALQDVARSKNDLIESRLPLIARAHELAATAAEKSTLKRGYLLSGDQAMLTRLADTDVQFEELLAETRADADPEVDRALTDVAEDDARWTAAFRRLVEQRQSSGNAASVADDAERLLFPAYDDLRGSLADVVATQEAAVATDLADSEQRKRTAVLTLWVLAGLTVAVVAVFATWMTRRIARHLRALALSVDSAAHDILAVVSQQVSGASEQSAAVQQTVATVDELVQTAEQAVERAQAVADRAKASAQVAGEGNRAVADSDTGMRAIREQVETIAQTVVELSHRAQLIREVVRTVDSIAAETHLLALNAAVEAARAGEHGRGFAVVAGEVRNLSEQSKAATSKVSGILTEIETGTDAAVIATEEGTKSSEVGTDLIARAGATIEQLAGTISSAALAAEQIAASSRQQAAATVQISDAMRNVNTVMEQNVAAARQSEQTARELTDAARAMKLLVGAD